MTEQEKRALVGALQPVVSRVRTDISAIKYKDREGNTQQAWTDEALTEGHLIKHVNGVGPARGCCPIKAGEDVTMVALFDLDSHKGEIPWSGMAEWADKITQASRMFGLEPIPFRSSGGNGIHLIFLWDDPQDAYTVRQTMKSVLESLGLKDGSGGLVDGQVEVFPKQDSVPVGGYGNQFVLPLAGMSEPLIPMLDYEPAGKGYTVGMVWPVSEPVGKMEKPVRALTTVVEGSVELAALRSALAAIPNEGEHELDYEPWRNVIFALHAETGGSDDGLALAHEFSSRSSKYDPDFLDNRVWPYITDREGGVTGRTILAMAKTHGWQEDISGMFEAIPYDSEISERDALIAEVNAAAEESVLRSSIIPKISRAGLSKVDLDVVVGAVQAKLRVFTGVKPSVKDIREMVSPRRQVQFAGAVASPEWVRPWVFSTDKDTFYNLETGERTSITGFNMRYGLEMTRYDDESGNTPAASEFCKTVWGVETVSGVAYMPGAGKMFEMLGLKWANSYSDRDVPEMPKTIDPAGLRAINLFIGHTVKLFPDTRERELFLSWMSHNVKHPGKKIRWAPFIYGQEGIGKSFYLTVLGLCLGSGNVAPLDAATVGNSSFTDWATGSAVRGMEEAKLHGHNAHDVMNKIKQFITNDVIDIHPKGYAAYRAINTTNYIIFSNYIDGLAITMGDRRYFVLHSSMTKDEAVELATGGYFGELFNTVEGNAGALRKWLFEYQWHEEFQPNGQAPMTDAKNITIELGKSDIHIAAELLIEKGGYGISKDVVSSNVFAGELKNITGEKIYGKTVNSMLASLGLSLYDRIKWNGNPHRVWLRVPKEKNDENTRYVRELLDATDKETTTM